MCYCASSACSEQGDVTPCRRGARRPPWGVIIEERDGYQGECPCLEVHMGFAEKRCMSSSHPKTEGRTACLLHGMPETQIMHG